MKLLLFALLILAPLSHAETVNYEILGGSLTQHIIGPAELDHKYRYKLNEDGLIANPMFGFREVHIDDNFYTSIVYFGGGNSIAEPMAGVAWSMGYAGDYNRVGLVAGIYLQNNALFLDEGIIPPMIIPYAGIGPVPLVGIEMTNTLYKAKDHYFFINSIVNPFLANVSLGIGW